MSKQFAVICWSLVGAQATLAVVLGVSEDNSLAKLGPIISVVVTMAFTVLHGTARYGWRDFAIFFAIAAVVSWTYETASILTGFPFGQYHYTERLGLKLWLVPVAIIPAYFGTAYLAWTIAQVLLGIYARPLTLRTSFLLPIIAAFIMVMWDVCMDPYMATILGNWVWHGGGAFYGVPLVNFLGWYLCVYTFYQLFAFYLLKKQTRRPPSEIGGKSYWLQPAVIYATGVPFYVIKLLYASNKSIQTADGKTWSASDIYASALLVTLVTMVFVAALTIFRVVENREDGGA